MKAKNKLVFRSIEIKDKGKSVMFWFKKTYQRSKHIVPMGFAVYPRKSDVIMVDFYDMDCMKGIVILVKVDEMYNIFKSLIATGYWSRYEGWIGW